MLAKKMKMQPFYIWWLGVAFFAPAVFIWVTMFVLFPIKGLFDCPFDWHGIRYIYLPFLAAVLGLCILVVCLRVMRRTSARVCVWVFIAYSVIMLTWGIIDIRCENYQLGGYKYPNGPLVDRHRYYFHQYYTWYFFPYRWIEKGIDESGIIEVDLINKVKDGKKQI